MGVSYDTSLGDRFSNFEENVEDTVGDTPGNLGGDLVNLITSGIFFVSGVASTVLFGAPKLLAAFGAPAFVTAPLSAVLPFIVVKDVIGYISGREV